MREKLANLGRLAAAGALFVGSVVGGEASSVLAEGGCSNIPPKSGEPCADPLGNSYRTNRFEIFWIDGNDFGVAGNTRFLGFLWETDDGIKEGVAKLSLLCGTLRDIREESRLFKKVAIVTTNLNPQPGCLIQKQIGGGGG